MYAKQAKYKVLILSYSSWAGDIGKGRMDGFFTIKDHYNNKPEKNERANPITQCYT